MASSFTEIGRLMWTFSRRRPKKINDFVSFYTMISQKKCKTTNFQMALACVDSDGPLCCLLRQVGCSLREGSPDAWRGTSDSTPAQVGQHGKVGEGTQIRDDHGGKNPKN